MTTDEDDLPGPELPSRAAIKRELQQQRQMAILVWGDEDQLVSVVGPLESDSSVHVLARRLELLTSRRCTVEPLFALPKGWAQR